MLLGTLLLGQSPEIWAKAKKVSQTILAKVSIPLQDLSPRFSSRWVEKIKHKKKS